MISLMSGTIGTTYRNSTAWPAHQSIALLIARVLLNHLNTFLHSTHVDEAEPFPVQLLLPLKLAVCLS